MGAGPTTLPWALHSGPSRGHVPCLCAQMDRCPHICPARALGFSSSRPPWAARHTCACTHARGGVSTANPTPRPHRHPGAQTPIPSRPSWAPPPATKRGAVPAVRCGQEGQMAVSGPQLRRGAHPPQGVLIHDVEGHRVEGGRQVHLVLLAPERAQGLPHSGCPTGEDSQCLSGPPAGPRPWRDRAM